MLIAYNDVSKVNKLKQELREEFEMKDRREARRILGMDIIRHQKGRRNFPDSREVSGKGVTEVWHRRCKAGDNTTSPALQVINESIA